MFPTYLDVQLNILNVQKRSIEPFLWKKIHQDRLIFVKLHESPSLRILTKPLPLGIRHTRRIYIHETLSYPFLSQFPPTHQRCIKNFKTLRLHRINKRQIKVQPRRSSIGCRCLGLYSPRDHYKLNIDEQRPRTTRPRKGLQLSRCTSNTMHKVPQTLHR